MIYMYRYIKNNKGSTLLMTLMTMTVLTILGVAVIAISVTNYRMRRIETNSRESFYKADSRYEDVYATIAHCVNSAITSGNAIVDTNMTSEISRLRDNEAADINMDNNSVINGTDGLGSINDEELIKHMNNHFFRPEYIRFINTNLMTNIQNATVDSQLATTVIIAINDTDTNGATDGNYDFSITYPSTHNGSNRTIEASYSIKVPDYEKPLDIVNDMVYIKENVLWTKAITTDGDLVVQCDEAVINGDIYAYGNSSNSVLVDKSSNTTELTINGNIFTNRWITTNRNMADLVVNNGDVYCNSIIIPSGVEDASININNGDLNTYDDIELNGKQSSIAIDGSYYGFNDGSGSVAHDQSSAIIINSDDIDSVSNRSTLQITGRNTGNHLSHIPSLDYPASDNGIYVFGTMYVDLTGPNYYQSGESLSIKGNYRAYSRMLDPEVSRASKFQPDKISFGSFPPMVLISSLDGNSPLVADKAHYFRYSNEDHGGLRTGVNDSISLSNIKYMLGSYVDNDVNDFTGSLPTYEPLRIMKERDFNYLVKEMGDLGELNPDIHDTTSSISFSKIDVDDRVNLSSSNNMRSYDTTTQELVVINSSSDVYIYSGSAPGSMGGGDISVRVPTDAVISNGIIATGGKVYLSGRFTFNGFIAASDDVIIMGDRVELNNSYYNSFPFKQSLLRLITSDDTTINAFNVSGNNGRDIYFSRQSVAGEDGNFKSYKKLRDVIDVHWSRIR